MGKKNWSLPSGIRKSRYRGEKTGREQLVLVLTVSRVPAQEMPPAGGGGGGGALVLRTASVAFGDKVLVKTRVLTQSKSYSHAVQHSEGSENTVKNFSS